MITYQEHIRSRTKVCIIHALKNLYSVEQNCAQADRHIHNGMYPVLICAFHINAVKLNSHEYAEKKIIVLNRSGLIKSKYTDTLACQTEKHFH
jgi:hypothetical protein